MNIKEHIEQLAEKQQSAWFHKDDVKRIIEEIFNADSITKNGKINTGIKKRNSRIY